MNHTRHVLAVAAAVVVAAVPAILADPAVQHYVSSHPWAAAYLPLVSGIVYAIYRAWRTRRSSSTRPIS